jgi:uncharacterized protein (TIGR04255 family)
MADRRVYSKPPLIEAVLELRFENSLSDRELIRLKDRLQKAYPAVDELKTFQAKLEPHGAVKDMGLHGFKMTAKTGADVVMLQQNALVTSRLAPYRGWEALAAVARENHAAFEKVVGYKRIVRIGARFVNRIDVPNSLLANKDLSDLLNIRITLPPNLPSHRGPFSLAMNFVHSSSKLKVLAQVATGDAMLIDHTSIFLDLDYAIDEEIPPSVEQLWQLMGTMRGPKDDIFESFITPEIREIFK